MLLGWHTSLKRNFRFALHFGLLQTLKLGVGERWINGRKKLQSKSRSALQPDQWVAVQPRKVKAGVEVVCLNLLLDCLEFWVALEIQDRLEKSFTGL